MDLRASNAAPGDGWAFQRCLRREQQGGLGCAAPPLPVGHDDAAYPAGAFRDKPVTLADKRAKIISGSAEPEAAVSIVDQAEMTLTLDGAPVYPGKPQCVVPEKENHS